MPSTSIKPLGILQPLGGGDPIPLRKEEMVVGRRPTCDIRLDFENVSGKHCVLRLVKGVWHVRDLASTNGTTVNGQKIDHEHGLMPDDELGISSHYFTLDYDPIAPTSLQDANLVLEEEINEARRQSLMELAGLEADTEKRTRRARPERPPERIDRRSSDDETDFDDALPANFKDDANVAAGAATDEDFFKMIQGEGQERPRK
jgi:pSer/pThr/pTyr-binding forkhead associated (FHA) protein